MKILHVNTSATAGGAAIAARRIIQAEQRYGLDASLLTRDDLPDHLADRRHFLTERLEVWLNQKLRRRNLWAIDAATQGSDITRLPAFQEADIIHLHWINQGMLSLDNIAAIRRTGKPVVWTMHDMWPFTAVCHHADECTAWHDGTSCRTCTLTARLAAATYARKAALYAPANGLMPIHFVGCSQWLTDLARKSPLLSGHSIACIPNPIDTNFYAAADKLQARQQLHLPDARPLILFIAYKASDPRKGIQYLMEATADMDADVVVVGQGAAEACAAQGRKSRTGKLIPIGPVSDDQTIRSLYQACDVLAMPTLRDNLPNTIVEAMACGLPCAGFRIGGLPEMIDHFKNGYLCAYRDATDLRRGLRYVLESPHIGHLRRTARLKAVQTYSEPAVASKYASLYTKALAGQPF